LALHPTARGAPFGRGVQGRISSINLGPVRGRAKEEKMPAAYNVFIDIHLDDSKFYWKSFLTLDATPTVIVIKMTQKDANDRA
jgi:hypothetical protein